MSAVKKVAEPGQVIELRHVDLMNTTSITNFCYAVKKDIPRLDILVCNAAVVTWKYSTASDGTEST